MEITTEEEINNLINSIKEYMEWEQEQWIKEWEGLRPPSLRD